jgi:hypothetical protein
MHPDTHECPEVSNCSRLHSSGRHSNESGPSSMFDKKSNFLLKHRNGKIATSVWTSGLHCPDAILDKARRGEELQVSKCQCNTVRILVLIMEITCNKSATIRTLGQHRLDGLSLRPDAT